MNTRVIVFIADALECVENFATNAEVNAFVRGIEMACRTLGSPRVAIYYGEGGGPFLNDDGVAMVTVEDAGEIARALRGAE